MEMRRSPNWIATASLGGALLLALAGVGILGFAWIPGVGWILLLAALLLGALGIRARQALLEHEAALEQRESQAERMRLQLDQQQAAVDNLADGLDVALFICDAKATILYANRRATELFRFEQPLGRTILAVTLAYDLERLVIVAGATGEAQSAELLFTYPEEKVGIAKAWPSRDETDRLFLSIYEITDLRRLERVRRDFVANVSHELRTPLTVIRAMAETLLDEPDRELTERYLHKVIGEVDRLSMISQDLLVLSAAESNPVRKQSCDLAEIFRGVVQQLAQKAQAKGLTLSFSGEAPCIVEANPAQMIQVAVNLVDNAINYTPEGAVEVSVRAEGEMAVAQVRDTGIGIPVEEVPRIFERFYRVDKARSRATGGTGLGLSIVKHIVEAHGGAVEVDSALNQGSTFRIRLPQAPEATDSAR
jgi:two-component system, OmpR family, phosphate regulon sensor histidine kinase PhoR